jgi:3-phenylpropionate/cinnamic acid dioxygenase small subunit
VVETDERIMIATSSLELQNAVEQFLYREARIMDANQYDTWLTMWAEQCEYWVPCNDEGTDPTKKVSIIYATRQELEDRVWRLKGLHAHTQRPKSRCTRVLSNVELEEVGDSEITVQSTFTLCEVRKNETHLWFGRNVHTLLRTDDGFAIRRKKVILVNNDMAVPNLTFII